MTEKEKLNYMIDILTEWRDKGMPEEALVRVWRPRELDATHAKIEQMTISHKLTFHMLKNYLEDWVKDINTEAVQGWHSQGVKVVA